MAINFMIMQIIFFDMRSVFKAVQKYKKVTERSMNSSYEIRKTNLWEQLHRKYSLFFQL